MNVCAQCFGDLQQGEVLFAGESFLSFHEISSLECVWSRSSLQGFLETGKELTFRATDRKSQGLKEKLQGPRSRGLRCVGGMSMWCSKQCEDKPW